MSIQYAVAPDACAPGEGLRIAAQHRARSRRLHDRQSAARAIRGVGVGVAVPLASDIGVQGRVDRAAVTGQVVGRDRGHVAQIARLEVLVAARHAAEIQPVGAGLIARRPVEGHRGAGELRARRRGSQHAQSAGGAIGSVGVVVVQPVAANQRPQPDVDRAAVRGQIRSR